MRFELGQRIIDRIRGKDKREKQERLISDKEISVVVQGAIDKENTPLCLQSIRKYLPGSEIILSTWEGSDVDGLDYDVLMLNKDPGSFLMSVGEANNVERQILSTLNGLKKSSRKYALKIRSDMELTGTGFLSYFDKFHSYNNEWHFLKKRIIIPSLITRDPRVWESPMCPSDWCFFGLTSDMLRLWNIDFPTEEEKNWFKYHKKTDFVKKHFYPLRARFNPEQFIWIGFVKKYRKNLHVDHMFDINKDSINETLLTYANNLIVLSAKQYGIKFLKNPRKGSDRWHILTHNEFLKIYNEYAGGNTETSFVDIEKLLAVKYLKQSYARLFRLAIRNSCASEFIIKEMNYYCPWLYILCKPLINILGNIENRNSLTVISKGSPRKTSKFSIVIPTHDNPEYFGETLNSLKHQTCSDFELIVTDDSSQKNCRNIIMKNILQFHNETGINITYVFSKENLGQSHNTNQGLKYVSGEWVRILHSDDLLARTCLQDELDILNNNNDVIAISNDIIPFSDAKKIDLSFEAPLHYEKLSGQFIINNALHYYCAIPSSLLFNSQFLSKNDGFHPGLVRACDWDFWSRIVLDALKNRRHIAHVSQKNVFYRIHNLQNSKKQKTLLTNYKEYKLISTNVEKCLKNMNYADNEIFNYRGLAFAYRKDRLFSDYKQMKPIYKLINLYKFVINLIEH